MCLEYKWVICAASCLGLIQSIVWFGLGLSGALLYLDVITVQPYNEPKDFFRVTLAKLYFEGPNSKINGSYLGQFNEDYRNPNVIDLLWPDKVFAVSVTYVIINVFYLFLSILLYSSRINNVKITADRHSNNTNTRRRFLDIAFGWSCITFILCAIDVVFVYFLLRDFLKIKEYVNGSSESKNVSDLVFIPLVLALVPGRIVILWVWNVIIASLFFFDVLCCKKLLRESLQPEEEVKQEQKVIGPLKPPQLLPPVKLINKSYGSSHDIKKDHDSVEVKQSVEAVTSFSNDYEKPQALQVYSSRDWNYAPSEDSFESAKWNPKLHLKEWDAINEAYESDEAGSVVLEQNLHPGQKQIKAVKPPIGKPVSIPIPPPLPLSESYRKLNESTCC